MYKDLFESIHCITATPFFDIPTPTLSSGSYGVANVHGPSPLPIRGLYHTTIQLYMDLFALVQLHFMI